VQKLGGWGAKHVICYRPNRMNYYAIKGPIIGEAIVVSLAPCCVCVFFLNLKI